MLSPHGMKGSFTVVLWLSASPTQRSGLSQGNGGILPLRESATIMCVTVTARTPTPDFGVSSDLQVQEGKWYLREAPINLERPPSARREMVLARSAEKSRATSKYTMGILILKKGLRSHAIMYSKSFLRCVIAKRKNFACGAYNTILI